MALANLKEDAKAIVEAIKRGASSSDDPVRNLLNRIPADFEMEQDIMVKEIMLQQKKIPGKGKGYEGEGSEIFGDRKKEVEDLQFFSKMFGAETWLAVKFENKKWFFLNPEDMHVTEKNYSIKEDIAEMKGLIFEELIESAANLLSEFGIFSVTTFKIM